MARIVRDQHRHQTALANDPSKDISANQWNEVGATTAHIETGMFGLPTSVGSVSLASNTLTPVDTSTIVKASSGTSDTLNFIDTVQNNDQDIFILRPFSGHTITIANNASSPPANTGVIITLTGANFNLDANVPLILQRNGNTFYQIALNLPIVNTNVAAGAAVAYSKLNLSGSILNADISVSAAIDPTKINGTAGVLNGAQTWTNRNTISPTTTTALLLNHPTGPTGSASGFVGALNVVSGGTIAFATTPQTGTFYGALLNAATLTNPSSGTITNAYTLYISGPPIASTNVTITNPYALYINSGTTVLQATTVAGTLTMSSANIALGTNSITGNFTATGSPTVQGSLTVGTGSSGGQTDFIYLLMNNGFGSDYPTSGSGGAIGWNFSSPGVDFWNITTSATTSFVFRQLTGASAQTTLMAISPTGLFSTYATRGTAGLGVATVFGSTLQKSETGADANVLTYTPPATAGRYRVSVSISVSAATAATLGWTAVWTDSNGHAQTPANLPLFTQNSTTVGLTISVGANVTYSGSWELDIDNSAANIIVKTTFSGTSVAYKISAIVEQLA